MEWTYQITIAARAIASILSDHTNIMGSDKKMLNKTTVVFDIDDTLISMDGTGIKPIIDLYHHAIKLGFDVSIVTARPDSKSNRRETLRQLEEHNIVLPRRMYMRPDNMDPDKFKTMSRKHIEDQGFTVLCSVGDMTWDIGLYGGI